LPLNSNRIDRKPKHRTNCYGTVLPIHGIDAVGEDLAVLFVLFAVTHAVEAVDLGIDRVGDRIGD